MMSSLIINYTCARDPYQKMRVLPAKIKQRQLLPKMSSSRKRENPQPLDEFLVALKLPKFYQPLPSEASFQSESIASVPSLGEPPVPALPLSGGIVTSETKHKRKGKWGGKPYKVRHPTAASEKACTPVVELSSEVISSIYSVLGVEGITSSDHSSLVVIPVLHPHLFDKDMYAILRSRNNIGLAPDSGDVGEEGCVFIGALDCQLEGYLDLGGIFRDGRQSIGLVLILDKSSEDAKWQIKIEVGEAVWSIPVTMDPLLAKLSSQDIEQMFQGIMSVVKVFLPHDSRCGFTKSLPLEFWATDKICNSSLASDCNSKLVKRQDLERAVHQLIHTLHPDYCSVEQWKTPVEGLWREESGKGLGLYIGVFHLAVLLLVRKLILSW